MPDVSQFFTVAGYQQPQTRLGVDPNFGHYLCPSTASMASITVYTDQIAQVRVTDAYIPHCLHPTAAGVGSKTVYTDQLETFRLLDVLTCGDRSAAGSMTVYAGG